MAPGSISMWRKGVVGLVVALWAAVASAQTVIVNSTQSPPPTTMQNAVSANGNGTAIVATGYSQVVFEVVCSVACSGGTTINFEYSLDTSTFYAGYAQQLGTTSTWATTATTSGVYVMPVGGAIRSVRTRISAYSAGTITIKGYLGVTPFPLVGVNTAASQSGTWNITNISGTISLPTGAATAAKQPALGTAGSASTDVITVQGIASMTKLLVTPDSVALPANQSVNVAQLAGTATSVSSGNKDSGTLRVTLATDQVQLTNKLLVTPDLPALAATSTKQSDGTQKTQIVDGSGNVIASTSNNLNVQCANCSGSGASAADEASFTAGTSTFAPAGGFFQTTATNNALTNLQQGMFQATAQRAIFSNLRNASGTEIGTSTTPVQVSLANTGANATAVKVDGSAVTQPVSGTVTANAGTNLNTSALALESGGNLATVAGAVIAQEATTSGVKGVTAFGAVTTAKPTYTTAKSDALSLDVNGLLRVSLADTPVNATKLLVTPDLPSGASTAAKQPALGTAGTASSDVITIQGIASMTKLLVTPDSVALPANQSVNVAQIAGTTTVTAGVSGAQAVGGCVATNVAITCNPNLMAAQAVSSENSAATTARAVQLVADLVGKLIVMPYANPENNLDGTITTAMTGTTSTVFSGMGAQGGSLRVYVTACTVSNAHATVGTDVVLQDGSGGTTLWTLPAAPAYGGAHAVFPNPLKTTANTALYAANVTTGASTKISCTGYKGL